MQNIFVKEKKKELLKIVIQEIYISLKKQQKTKQKATFTYRKEKKIWLTIVDTILP